MNGLIPKTAAGLLFGAGLAALAGCHSYRDCVDPCWFQRNTMVDRQIVRETFNAQTGNGHTLDQTVWSYYFETDAKDAPTAKLNAAGLEHLKYLARRQPGPDPKIFVQTEPETANLFDQRAMNVRQKFSEYTAARGIMMDPQVERIFAADPSVSAFRTERKVQSFDSPLSAGIGGGGSGGGGGVGTGASSGGTSGSGASGSGASGSSGSGGGR